MSVAGGVAPYVNSKLNYLIREEFNVTENKFECIWIEVKNSKIQKIYYVVALIDTQTLSSKVFWIISIRL